MAGDAQAAAKAMETAAQPDVPQTAPDAATPAPMVTPPPGVIPVKAPPPGLLTKEEPKDSSTPGISRIITLTADSQVVKFTNGINHLRKQDIDPEVLCNDMFEIV